MSAFRRFKADEAPRRLLGLVITADRVSTRYELPVVTDERVGRYLIGWVQNRPPVDAGVPEGVKHLLAQALTRNFAVTFLAENTDHFVHATEPDVAEHMFARWPTRAQVTFLSRKEAQTKLEIRDLDRIFERGFDAEKFAAATGAMGELLPGADGDWGGLYTFSKTVWPLFERALQEECAGAGVFFHVMSPADFAAVDWYPEHAVHTSD